MVQIVNIDYRICNSIKKCDIGHIYGFPEPVRSAQRRHACSSIRPQASHEGSLAVGPAAYEAAGFRFDIADSAEAAA